MAEEVTKTAEPEVTNTLEELQAQLAQLRTENEKLKSATTNASADASKYKKALQERMSEQERAANETKELIDQLKAENAALKRNQTLAEYTSGYMGVGFDEILAKKAAAATVDGDFSAITTALKDFITAHDKAIAADALRSTPRPGAGAVEKSVTQEQFDAMGYAERVKLFEEQPDLYKELTK